jgi:hypothetical protein
VNIQRTYRILWDALFLATFVGIGGMQMLGLNAGPVTSYGADLLAPPLIYVALRRGPWFKRDLQISPVATLSIVLIACGVWEVSQRYDLSGTPLAVAAGTFDPLDLVAYAVGLAGAWWLDVRVLVPNGITKRTPRSITEAA